MNPRTAPKPRSLLLALGLLLFRFKTGKRLRCRLLGSLGVMLVIARQRVGVAEVDVKQSLRLLFGNVFGQRNFGREDAPRACQHALFAGGQAVLIDIALGQVAHDLGDLIHVAC